MRCVVYTGAGGNEVVACEERPDPVCGDEEVLIHAAFAGLNGADVAQRKGAYPAPPGWPADIPGLEVAGVIDQVGTKVRGWKIGDRAYGLVGGGGLADRVAVHERCVVPVPSHLDAREIAAIPEVFITAHDAIATQAGLRPGDTLLVHGAAGGVGSAAVQIGVAAGATVIGVSRHAEGRAAIAGWGATAIDAEGWTDAVLELTGGRGADVVLELVGAPNFEGDVRAVARRGRIAIVGIGAGQKVELQLRDLMAKRVTVFGTTLRARPLEEKVDAIQRFHHELGPLFDAGRLQPVIDRAYPWNEAAEALARMEGAGKIGKVLLDFAS
ncbi:MAG: NAD(P)H-quinone oxidoreductase [Gaiellales bacterium]